MTDRRAGVPADDPECACWHTLSVHDAEVRWCEMCDCHGFTPCAAPQRVTRICARADCGAPFFTTLYSPEAFCSPRCRNKAKGQNR